MSTSPQLPLTSRHLAVQPEVETMVEQRAVDEVHRFLVSSKLEYFVKFEVPELIMDKYNADPEKHVFQVQSVATWSDQPSTQSVYLIVGMSIAC